MPEEHSCTGVVESDFVTCPICNQKLRVMPGEVPGDKVPHVLWFSRAWCSPGAAFNTHRPRVRERGGREGEEVKEGDEVCWVELKRSACCGNLLERTSKRSPGVDASTVDARPVSSFLLCVRDATKTFASSASRSLRGAHSVVSCLPGTATSVIICAERRCISSQWTFKG